MEEREANVPKLIETLVPLMKEFLENGQEALDYTVEFSRPYLELEFEWYAALPDDVKPRYLEMRCIYELFAPLHFVMSRDAHWVSVLERYMKQFNAPKLMALTSRMRPTNHDPKNLPDRRTAISIMRDVIASEFPNRALNPRTRQVVSMGMKDSTWAHEAYLFPDKTDPGDVLFVRLDSGFFVTGGFGRGEYGFFTGFLFPCLGIYLRDYSSPWEFERPEQTLRMFCKMLKYVYPYHVRLWEGYFGANQEAGQQGALPECEEGLEHE